MDTLQSEESDGLDFVLRKAGEYEVAALRLEHFRESSLDLCLQRKFENVVLRFWSPRSLEIHRDDDTPRLTVLIEDEPQGTGGVRVGSPPGAKSTIRFLARAVETFKRWPTSWDMVIDEVAHLCLWVWRMPVSHFGVMNHEVGLPDDLVRRLDEWIKSKREGSRSPHELDAEGRELAPLVRPYLGSDVVLRLYSEVTKRYERVE